MIVHSTERERHAPRRIGALALSKQALSELMGLPPGHVVNEVFADPDTPDLVRIRVEGPQMPLCWPGNVIRYLNATIERLPGGGTRCEIHGLVEG